MTAVDPDGEQEDRPAGRRPAGGPDPELEQFLRRSPCRVPNWLSGDAGAEDVFGQEERDGEAEGELGRLEAASIRNWRRWHRAPRSRGPCG